MTLCDEDTALLITETSRRAEPRGPQDHVPARWWAARTSPAPPSGARARGPGRGRGGAPSRRSRTRAVFSPTPPGGRVPARPSRPDSRTPAAPGCPRAAAAGTGGRGQGPRPGSERAARSARPPRAVARGPSVAWSPPRSPDAALTSAGVSDLLGHPQPVRCRPGSGAALRVCLPNSFLPVGLEESVWKI